jgi:exopolysaccharide production protein ExoQ
LKINQELAQSLTQLLELVTVVLLLFFSESVSLPGIFSNILNLVGYIFILIIIIGRWKSLLYVVTRDISLLSLLLLAIFSLLWSASPGDTIENAKGLIRSTLFAIYLAQQYTPSSLIKLFSIISAIGMISSLIVAVLIPSYGIADGVYWNGIYGHKQLFGRFLCFASSIFFIKFFDKNSNRNLAAFGLGLSFLLILLSQSKTALLIFFILTLLMPLYKLAKRANPLIFSIILISTFLILCVSAIFISINLETILVDVLGKDTEFNGRVPIWTMAIEAGLKRPFFGYGYNAFWTSDAADTIILNSFARTSEDVLRGTLTFHGHNSFVDLFLQLGFAGLIIFIFNFINLIIRVVRLLILTNSIEYFWMFMYLAIYLVFNNTESLTLLTTNFAWIIYVTVALSSAINYEIIQNQGLPEIDMKEEMDVETEQT